MRPTLKTIAEEVGYSVATVSRVLNGQASEYRISKEAEQLITEVARKIDFSPNILAKGLRKKRTFTLGLVIPDISNPFFSNIVRNIERAARKMGYSIILCDSDENTDLEIQLLQTLKARKVDGLIVFPVGIDGRHLLKVFEQGIPLVLIDRCFPEFDIPFVCSDNYAGAKEAVSYLLENGHRLIACIQGLQNTMPNNDRVRGYRDAYRELGVEVKEHLIVGSSFGMHNGYIEAKMLLNLKNRPTAIFACSNLIALGSLQAISEENLAVPNDISIVSFDDQTYSSFLRTPMTTINQQGEEMGEISVRLLLNQLDKHLDKNQNTKIYLPTKLIKRKSVKMIAAKVYD